MNFSEIINDENISLQLKQYNRYMNEHADEIGYVKEDIYNELNNLYKEVFYSELEGIFCVSLNKEFTESDEKLINTIILTAIDRHTPAMPDFLRNHFFNLYNTSDKLFIKTK